jgi:hypothetical protein
MSRGPAVLKAWKFFKAKCLASGADAAAIVNIISSVGSLRGMYTSAARGKYKTWQEQDQAIEDMSHCRFSVDYVLLQFFDIDRGKYPNFDPVELSDSLGYDPRVAKLFKGKK